MLKTALVTVRDKFPWDPPPRFDCIEEELVLSISWVSEMVLYVGKPMILEIVGYGNPSTIIFLIMVVMIEEVLITDNRKLK